MQCQCARCACCSTFFSPAASCEHPILGAPGTRPLVLACLCCQHCMCTLGPGGPSPGGSDEILAAPALPQAAAARTGPQAAASQPLAATASMPGTAARNYAAEAAGTQTGKQSQAVPAARPDTGAVQAQQDLGQAAAPTVPAAALGAQGTGTSPGAAGDGAQGTTNAPGAAAGRAQGADGATGVTLQPVAPVAADRHYVSASDAQRAVAAAQAASEGRQPAQAQVRRPCHPTHSCPSQAAWLGAGVAGERSAAICAPVPRQMSPQAKTTGCKHRQAAISGRRASLQAYISRNISHAHPPCLQHRP